MVRAKTTLGLALEVLQKIARGTNRVSSLVKPKDLSSQTVYTRKDAQVVLANGTRSKRRKPSLGSRHLVALPIVQEQSERDPLFIFKQWVARMLILRPIPSLIIGDSIDETLLPNLEVTKFGAWFSGLLANTPAAYAKIDAYLKRVMPDLKDIRNPLIGKESRSLVVQLKMAKEF